MLNDFIGFKLHEGGWLGDTVLRDQEVKKWVQCFTAHYLVRLLYFTTVYI